MVAAAAAAAAAVVVVVGLRRHVVVKIALGRHVCSIGLIDCNLLGGRND